MKKLVVFIFIIISYNCFSQESTLRGTSTTTSVVAGVSTAEATSISQSVVSDSIENMKAGVFNVLDYGAISGDGQPDQAAIQSAINAAYAWGGATTYLGPTVLIPPGIYNITTADTLKSDINIYAEGALFSFATGYTGKMWVNSTALGLRDCNITGGDYNQEAAGYTFNLFDLTSSSTSFPVTWNNFKNMNAGRVGIVINLSTTVDGWVNSNNFTNINVHGCIEGVKTRGEDIDGNIYRDIVIQCQANMTYGIDSLSGDNNHFYNFFLWDAVAGGPDHTAVLSATAEKNYLEGTFIDNVGYSDIGNLNYVVSDGELISTPQYRLVNTGEIDPAIGITTDMLSGTMVFTGTSAVDITVDPQIPTPGAWVGKEITIFGSSDTYTLTLDDLTGLRLSAQWIGGLQDAITLRLIQISTSRYWIEVSRSNN
jgi:hypothetical protein